MLSIVAGELIQIFRNRLVLITSLIIPVVVSAFFVRQHETYATLGYIAATVMFTITLFGLYATAVTTLASRRQNLVLRNCAPPPNTTPASSPACCCPYSSSP
ncbi:hypothetical protein [Micromonospora endolithica]|uniref:hypothetical protein n=1 Tax=Micromonospora endolithica TaxID=230091 RepID=UPI0011AC90E0|nr:hypothetical protein [Micromonospora endolithica]TWJ25183.1 ABC-2 type transport system permease protein [Micromonospora endolithica]